MLTPLMKLTNDLIKLKNDRLQGTVGAIKNDVVRIDDNPNTRFDAAKVIGNENQEQNVRENPSMGTSRLEQREVET